MKKKIVSLFSGFVSIFGGACLFGLAMNMFLSPGSVVMGGATGIATTVNYLFPHIPIGLMIMAINVPLLLLNAKYVGGGAMLKTIGGIVLSSVMIDTLTFLPVTLDDPLLCSVLGGVTMGCGAGMLLTRGFTTGGSDLAALMLKRRFKMLTTGRIIMVIDVVVVVGAAVITKNYEGILYSAVAIFAYSTALDSVMGGADKAKIAYIVSEKHEDIAKAITEQLGRGITVINGSGYYTGNERKILMCVVKRHEEYAVKSITEKCDPMAFMILSDATEVLGMGFKPHREEDTEAEKKNKKAAKKEARRLRKEAVKEKKELKRKQKKEKKKEKKDKKK